ncbi:MAG TPA: phospholipid carrier-dependent glycosyltransferase [Chloroflexi bacterium]|nr:phospholipid carrier-dependent glycosyltransferase [Chloroflexota bacterium]
MEKRQQLVAYGLLFALFAQVALAARHTSITLDEPLHITSGYACLVTGDYRLVEEHPPLLKMLQAAPLLLARPSLHDPRNVPGWDEGNLIVAAQHVVVPYRPIEPLVFAARVPTMLVGVLLAALVYRWATDAFGWRAGLLALALCAFDPNILAHASVAATDLGAACAIFAATYTFWRWIRQPDGPSWRRGLVAAVVLGLALGVKSTVLMLLPIFGLFILVARPSQRSLRPYLGQALATSAVAFVVLWALYRFEFGAVPGWDFPTPAPSHFLPLLKLQEHMREGHSAFLMGRNYHHGVWYYFPVAFALKTPPLTLALILLTALGLISRRIRSAGWRGETAMLSLPLLYFGVSLTSGINIGYRHLLPILPFLFVWVSRLAPWVWRFQPRAFRAALRAALCAVSGVALGGYVLVTVALSPWHLAYFNLFAGGVDGGYHYLVDSNLDWGQTWKALKRYVDEHHIIEFGLSQYTINDPHAYDLDYTPLPPWPDAPPVLPRRFNPAPGVYAISTTTLQGVVVADSEMFDYFRKRTPVERVGYAMFVYEIDEHVPGEWAAQCTHPVAPLPPDVLKEGLGRDDLRLTHFDCAQSWLYPPGDGWYVLSRDVGDLEPSLVHARRARLAYEQTRTGSVPPFAVYEWFERAPLNELKPSPIYAAPSDWPPAQAETEGMRLTQPVKVGHDVEFLGYVAAEKMDVAAPTMLQTYWRVMQTPTQALSLMAHLLDANGAPIAVGDGLGVPVDQWRPGDVIVQFHEIAPPPETSPGVYWLQTGAYTLPDLRRLSILYDAQVLGDRLLLGQIKVER